MKNPKKQLDRSTFDGRVIDAWTTKDCRSSKAFGPWMDFAKRQFLVAT